ncbi:Prkd1 [Symbiodinium natans]|uniref:Prkd1 protein n=1 Tax=Symbiodinium natans TaxID=878477 RepID=A0A812UMS1_9DINO|nr:Prkd1 [Symbiodinium natans]
MPGCCGSTAATPAPQEHFFTQYKLGKKLGEGAFGQVRVVVDRSTQQELAVKIVDVRERDEHGACSGAVSKSRDRVTRTEVDLWTKASNTDCEYIVKLYKSFAEHGPWRHVERPVLLHGQTRPVLSRRQMVEAESMTETDLAKIFRHMLLGVSHTHVGDLELSSFQSGDFKEEEATEELGGLQFCFPGHHSQAKGVPQECGSNDIFINQFVFGFNHVHRTPAMTCVFAQLPSRPDNFLWGGPDNSVLKLCDYGLAVMMPKTGKLSGVFGTAPYMAPEMLRSEGYDFLADVWSIGSVAYLLVFGSFPYSPSEALPVAAVPEGLGFEGSLWRAAVPDRVPMWGFLEALRHEFVAEKVAIIPDANDFDPLLRKNAHKARSLTQQMRQKRDSTVQHGIDDLLKKLIIKNGGDISNSNIFFSEGDEKLDQEDEEPRSMEPRMKRRSSRRDVKHSTHSGVIDQSGSLKFDMSPNSAVDSRASGKSAPGDVPGLSNRC